MDTNQAIILARKHVHNGAAMQSSAELCLTDAVRCYERGELSHAMSHAKRSLGYSVGILHVDYQRVLTAENKLLLKAAS